MNRYAESIARQPRRQSTAEYEFRQFSGSGPGGYLDTFRLQDPPVRYSVYCPHAAIGAHEIDAFVYVHGLLDRCPPEPKNLPEDLITKAPFRLAHIVDDSGRPLVLVVPLIDWRNPVALGHPTNLNALVAGAQNHLAELLGAPPVIRSLIVGGHSRAYSVLETVAKNYAHPHMRQGALAQLSEIWMLDSTYVCDLRAWTALLGAKPGLKVRVYYRKGSPTASCGKTFAGKSAESGGRLVVNELEARKVEHCDVPGYALPSLISAYSAGASMAHEAFFGDLMRPLRARIIQCAEDEWTKWKQGTIGETSDEATPLLTKYWDAVGESPKPDQLRSKVWQASHPWSAAFISYVIKEAGAGASFSYSAYHTGYLAAAKHATAHHDASKFQAFPVDQVPLEPGDVVCHDRQDPPGGPCAGTNFENAATKGHMISHGEIVLEVNLAERYAITIGGNTSQSYPRVRGALGGDTVGKHKIKIDEHGHCIANQGACPYFGVLKPPAENAAPQHELVSRRWSWMSPDAETRRGSGSSLEYDVGGAADTHAIRITVVGHASARWRGAGSRAEAARLNEALSIHRADNIRKFVEQVLRERLPGVPILPGTSPAPGQHPTGLQVGSYGVGSREPLAPSNSPAENDPKNRSVQVLIELTTTQHSSKQVHRPPLRIDTRTDHWFGQVLSLKGAAIGAAGYKLELKIRNPISNKTATYSALMGGGGVGGPISLSGDDLEGEFSFQTSDAMGFGDFDGQWVRIERAGASLGVRAIISYLTFTSLGSGASLLPFQKDLGFSLSKPNLEGFVVTGKLSMEGRNPGDWYEVDGGVDTVPLATDRNTGDGMVLTFPTGRAALNDISQSERKRLRDFVINWAQRL